MAIDSDKFLSRHRRRRWAIRLSVVFGIAIVLAGVSVMWLVLGDNFHEIVPDEVYRSAQPDPDTLKRWIKDYHLKTIINLRGASSLPFYDAEQQIANEAGITMIDIDFSAVRQPSTIQLRKLIDALETAPRPLLIHCRAGADRTGLASVIAAMAIGGENYEKAKSQMSVRYLHIDNDPTHIGGVLDDYETWCQANGRTTDGWQQFRQWATQTYHPLYYHIQVTTPAILTARPGQTLMTDITIKNASTRLLPANDADKLFTLAVFAGSSENERPDREFGPRTPLPKRDIAPGESVTVRQKIVVPKQPGRYEIHFDVIEEHRTWFARQGSPVATCELVVRSPESTGQPESTE